MMRRRTQVMAMGAAVAMIAAALVSTVALGSAGAQQAGPAEGTYLLRNADNGRYLDADFGDFNVETSANPGDDDEWELIANGDGTWLLRNEVTGRYLDGDGANRNFNVDQSVNPSDDDRWRIEPAGDGTYFVISDLLNRYLDADGSGSNFNVDTSSSPRLDDEWELIAIDVEPPVDPPPAPLAGEVAIYDIEFTNITDGQYLTPPNFAAHGADADVFEVGQPANAGVQAVAENGGVPVLAELLNGLLDANDAGVSGVGADAPLPPGATTNFQIVTSADRLSIVSMVICTNDGFAGLDSQPLPDLDGGATGYLLDAYDAGTEINTEQRIDLVPAPFCGEGPGTGESNPELAENGVITLHPTLQNTGDLDPGLDWDGPVAEVIITRSAAFVPSFDITVENLTDAQYLTPPNWAVHSAAADVYQVGQPASAGVQAVAENGGVAVLAAELAGALDATGLGISGVGDVGGPIAPGASVTFTATGDAERLSIVSMIICTNDGFTGLDSRPVPGHGESLSYLVRGYDAGTEFNSEVRADLVPAPFCGEGPGSGESNPELAEGGVVRPHRTLVGIGDLDPALDWAGPVARITVTRGADVPAG